MSPQKSSSTKGIIRIASVHSESANSITTSEDGVFPSLNPYIICATTAGIHWSGNDVDFQAYAFSKMFNTGHPIEYSLYVDDNFVASKSSSIGELVDFVEELSRGTHEAKLTVTGIAPDGRPVTESITRGFIVGKLFVKLMCPTDIIVTDPSGRSLGKQVNEIPNATYTEFDLDKDGEPDKLIEILAPIDGNYTLKLNGTGPGSYSMITQFAISQEIVSFNATEIPIFSATMHQYTIDWTALSQNEEGITLQIDSDNDGFFEQTVTADNELTYGEFLLQTATCVDIVPDELNLRSQGKWITVYIQLPEGYNAADINASTLLLNGTIQPVLDPKYGLVTNSSEYLTDHNNDGILERMLKFNRAELESYIYRTQGIRYGNVALTITGELFDGTEFKAIDTIFVNYAGDANNDGIINLLDMGVVSAHWGTSDCNADCNRDGIVNLLDMGIISANWGQTTP